MLLEFTDLSLARKGELYTALYNQIKAAIESKVLKKGEKLPSVRQTAAQLNVSRTTVENAYTRLCIEGFCEALPQRGYFILGVPKKQSVHREILEKKPEIIYDFSSKSVDAAASDTDLWKRLVRSVLWDNDQLNTYGDPQGELSLRQALADYSFKARGVIASPQSIVIGAGVGTLLNILCGLIGRDLKVGMESRFAEAERIFTDYGIKADLLTCDKSGATVQAIKDSNPQILFCLPSALAKISPTELSARRNFYKSWAEEENRLIIEDDYNGELRYTARSIPAFQSKAPQSTVYIGSFSKLLLPSVRIAFMVLPEGLAEKFREVSSVYNQTCGKIEQLALEKYISSGALEKHLKRLRRLYYSKSQLLCLNLTRKIPQIKSLTLFESSLMVEATLNRELNTEKLIAEAEKAGVKLATQTHPRKIRLCFAGIPEEKIPQGVDAINKILEKM